MTGSVTPGPLFISPQEVGDDDLTVVCGRRPKHYGVIQESGVVTSGSTRLPPMTESEELILPDPTLARQQRPAELNAAAFGPAPAPAPSYPRAPTPRPSRRPSRPPPTALSDSGPPPAAQATNPEVPRAKREVVNAGNAHAQALVLDDDGNVLEIVIRPATDIHSFWAVLWSLSKPVFMAASGVAMVLAVALGPRLADLPAVKAVSEFANATGVSWLFTIPDVPMRSSVFQAVAASALEPAVEGPEVIHISHGPPELTGYPEQSPSAGRSTDGRIETRKQRTERLLRHARRHLRAGNLRHAEDYYRAASKVSPGRTRTHVQLIRVLLEQGKGPDALRAARRAVKERPDSAAAHLALGDTHAELGDLSRAKRAWTEGARRGSHLARSRLSAW